jgi:hypothetical protein
MAYVQCCRRRRLSSLLFDTELLFDVWRMYGVAVVVV